MRHNAGKSPAARKDQTQNLFHRMCFFWGEGVLGLTSISTHFRSYQDCACIPEGMIPLYSVVSLKYHTAGTIVWYPTWSHYSGIGSISFCIELYPLYVEHLKREHQLPIWNLWFDSAGNRTWDLPDTERMYHRMWLTDLLSLISDKTCDNLWLI